MLVHQVCIIAWISGAPRQAWMLGAGEHWDKGKLWLPLTRSRGFQVTLHSCWNVSMWLSQLIPCWRGTRGQLPEPGSVGTGLLEPPGATALVLYRYGGQYGLVSSWQVRYPATKVCIMRQPNIHTLGQGGDPDYPNRLQALTPDYPLCDKENLQDRHTHKAIGCGI